MEQRDIEQEIYELMCVGCEYECRCHAECEHCYEFERAVKEQEIIRLTAAEFNNKYPHNTWDVNELGKFTGLPLKLFVIEEENGTFTAIDNTTGDAWTEEFKTEEEAINWLIGEEYEQN